jgi:hypothetical protein
MLSMAAGWQDAARRLFKLIYGESVGRVVDEKTRELIAALLFCPNVKSEWKNPVASGFVRVIPGG